MAKRVSIVWIDGHNEFRAVTASERKAMLADPSIVVSDCVLQRDTEEALLRGEWLGSNPLPRDLCKKGTEHGHQTALFCWAAAVSNSGIIPELSLMYAVPNGGSRGADRFEAAKTGAMLKAEGVRKGVPDLFLPVPVDATSVRCTVLGDVIAHDARCVVENRSIAGLYVEMKIEGGVVSEAQAEMIAKLKRQGYAVGVCYSWQEAASLIRTYFGR